MFLYLFIFIMEIPGTLSLLSLQLMRCGFCTPRVVVLLDETTRLSYLTVLSILQLCTFLLNIQVVFLLALFLERLQQSCSGLMEICN